MAWCMMTSMLRPPAVARRGFPERAPDLGSSLRARGAPAATAGGAVADPGLARRARRWLCIRRDGVDEFFLFVALKVRCSRSARWSGGPSGRRRAGEQSAATAAQRAPARAAALRARRAAARTASRRRRRPRASAP